MNGLIGDHGLNAQLAVVKLFREQLQSKDTLPQKLNTVEENAIPRTLKVDHVHTKIVKTHAILGMASQCLQIDG